MTLEELQALLESGAITQEQFDGLSQALQAQNDSGKTDPDNKKGDDIEDIISRAVDRATNKLGNENKKLKADLDKFKKTHLTEKQLQEDELAEREAQIEEREKQIKLYENKDYTLKAIKKAGLDSGDETALAIAEFLVADDETAIDERVTAFKSLVDAIVQKEVDATFKSKGRIPDKGNNTGSGNNPYSKDTWNLTQQMLLEKTDPEQAAAYKAAAGIK